MRDLKSEFLGSTSLTKAPPLQKVPVNDLKDPEASAIEFIPVKPPQSVTMFCHVLCDIAASSYMIRLGNLSYFIDIYDDGSFGIILRPEENNMTSAEAVIMSKSLWRMLDDLEILDYEKKLNIDKSSFEILSPNKMSLYTVIDRMVEALPQSVTPEDIEFKRVGYDREIKNQQILEYMVRNATRAKELRQEDPDMGRMMLYYVESRPYSSMTQFESAMCAGRNATLRTPLSHLYRTICYEDHIPVRETRFANYGGYN